MPMSQCDRETLRRLGTELAQIAVQPAQRRTRESWKALNGLKPIRPMVMMDQLPWHEMNVDDELTLECHDAFCREIETSIRRTIYRWKHMRADMVVEPWLEIGKVIHDSGYGVARVEHTATLDPGNDVIGHYYLDQFQTEEDLAKIHAPVVSLDAPATQQREEIACEIFSGILPVKMQGMFPWCAPWDIITQWRGVEATLYDVTDRPEFMHKLVDRITDSYLGMLDSAQQQGLLGYCQQYIHCTGAWCDELPKKGFVPGKPRTQDNWTFGMAQIFGAVSRDMHDEFEIPCMQRIYARFGMGYYGCCEPLDDRIDLVRKIPNVRKISMSPWTNQRRGADAIGRDFVFSRKPSPALLAVDSFNPGAVEKDLRETIDICREYGCPLELILKDVSTIRYDPKRLWQWHDIAMSLVREG